MENKNPMEYKKVFPLLMVNGDTANDFNAYTISL